MVFAFGKLAERKIVNTLFYNGLCNNQYKELK